MTDKTYLKWYELKGKLEATALIVDNALAGLKGLSNEVESQYYKGHTQGKIEALSIWSQDVARLQADVEQAIKEAESE